MDSISATSVRDELDYDSRTGVFRWKKPGRGRTVGRRTGQFDGRYVKIKVAGKRYYAHRLAWAHVHGVWPTGDLDHVDEDKANNRISNLREATRDKNMANVSAPCRNNKSGHRGVSKRRGGYRATFRGRYLGDFPTVDQACDAYAQAKRKFLT